ETCEAVKQLASFEPLQVSAVSFGCTTAAVHSGKSATMPSASPSSLSQAARIESAIRFISASVKVLLRNGSPLGSFMPDALATSANTCVSQASATPAFGSLKPGEQARIPS